MNRRKGRKMLRQAFKLAGVDKIFKGYLLYFIVVAIVIWIVEPSINRFGDSLWYCFAVATTVGFGDFAATTILGRIITIILSIYSLGVVALFTAIITSFLWIWQSRRHPTVQKSFCMTWSTFQRCRKKNYRNCQNG